MQSYSCMIFDLYNTLIDDTHGMIERDQYRQDSIYTILEKSLFPIKFPMLQKAFADVIVEMGESHDQRSIAFSPFYQVNSLLNKLNVHDVVVFKKVYDSYVDAILQISPKLTKNSERALRYLKEKEIKIGLISNTGMSSGVIIRLLLKELNIFQYFDDMVFSDEAGILKPDPMIFDISIKRLGVLKKDVLFVGDSKITDFDGAKNAGITSHLFKKDEEDLYQIAVDYSEEN